MVTPQELRQIQAGLRYKGAMRALEFDLRQYADRTNSTEYTINAVDAGLAQHIHDTLVPLGYSVRITHEFGGYIAVCIQW